MIESEDDVLRVIISGEELETLRQYCRGAGNIRPVNAVSFAIACLFDHYRTTIDRGKRLMETDQ